MILESIENMKRRARAAKDDELWRVLEMASAEIIACWHMRDAALHIPRLRQRVVPGFARILRYK